MSLPARKEKKKKKAAPGTHRQKKKLVKVFLTGRYIFPLFQSNSHRAQGQLAAQTSINATATVFFL